MKKRDSSRCIVSRRGFNEDSRVSEVIKHVNEINKLIDGYVTDKNKTRTLELKFRDDKTFYLLIFLGKGEKKSQITIQTVVY